MIKVTFKGVDIELVYGSSSLFRYGIIPIAKSQRVPKVSERGLTANTELGKEFLEVFADQRIKTRLFSTGDPDSVAHKLLNEIDLTKPKKARVTRTPGVTKRERLVFDGGAKADVQLPQTNDGGDINLFTMMGISGTGKGTRMSQIIHYLSTKYESQILVANLEKPTEKNYVMGTWFPELNIMFLGKWSISNRAARLISWSSFDWIQKVKAWDGSTFYDLMAKLNSKYGINNFAYEGYVNMTKYILIHDTVKNLNSLSTQYFAYPKDGLELLQDRCVGRSGKRIKGTCWEGNMQFFRIGERHQKDIDNGTHPNDFSELLPFDATVASFGNMVLGSLKPELLGEFNQFTAESNTIRSIDDEGSSIEQLSTYIEKQNAALVEGSNIDV